MPLVLVVQVHGIIVRLLVRLVVSGEQAAARPWVIVVVVHVVRVVRVVQRVVRRRVANQRWRRRDLQGVRRARHMLGAGRGHHGRLRSKEIMTGWQTAKVKVSACRLCKLLVDLTRACQFYKRLVHLTRLCR